MRIQRIAFAVLALSCLAMPAKADIFYTWHEDDSQAVTGSLVVNSSALAAGSFTNGDVISFAWTDPSNSYTTTDLQTFTEGIPISTIDGSFTDSTSFPHAGGLTFPTTVESMSPNGRYWYDGEFNGVGHWTVSLSSVPEPSSLLLSAIAGAVGIGAWARRRSL